MTTENEVLAAIEKRYQPPEWAFFPHVRNTVGFANRVRTADALVLNTWPSRGLELHGFEVKVSRADWLREKKNPKKSIEMQQYCDRWWIVAPSNDYVHKDELPPTWGLLGPRGKKFTGNLVCKVEAPKLKTKTLDHRFVCSLIRKLYESRKHYVLRSELKSEIQAEYKRGRKSAKRDIEHAEQLRDRAIEKVAEWEHMIGMSIDSWRWGNVKELLDILRDGQRLEAEIEKLVGLHERTKRAVELLQGYRDPEREEEACSE